ncbi:MAG: NAD(P)-dependent alcohol dehydrogenase [Anaerolineales bacterium]
MNAMVYRHYGSPDVLELREIERPLIEDDGVLVKVHSASLNWLDWHFLTGTPLMARLMTGLLKPRHHVLGVDVAGRVEVVGADVDAFKPGDEVFGSTDNGCFAEYVCVRPHELQPKPAKLPFEAAAAVGAAASTALHGLRQGQVKPGRKVLINGASGGVGTFAVQIARSLGVEVTGVCSTRNLDLVRSLGAGRVIDYTRYDFTHNAGCYDLIFDVAAKSSFLDCQRALKPQGFYVTTAFSPVLALQGRWISMTGSQKMTPLAPQPPSNHDLIFIKELLERGEINPVIDRCYLLHELPQAFRYLSKGHTHGKIVITINQTRSTPAN